MPLNPVQRRYWRYNLRLTVLLLGIWFVVTFGSAYFADRLNQFEIFGFPLGFYMNAQGNLLVFILIVGVYALLLNRLDRRHGIGEEE